MIHPFGVELAGQLRASKGGHARAAGCARLTGEEGVGGSLPGAICGSTVHGLIAHGNGGALG